MTSSILCNKKYGGSEMDSIMFGVRARCGGGSNIGIRGPAESKNQFLSFPDAGDVGRGTRINKLAINTFLHLSISDKCDS